MKDLGRIKRKWTSRATFALRNAINQTVTFQTARTWRRRLPPHPPKPGHEFPSFASPSNKSTTSSVFTQDSTLVESIASTVASSSTSNAPTLVDFAKGYSALRSSTGLRSKAILKPLPPAVINSMKDAEVQEILNVLTSRREGTSRGRGCEWRKPDLLITSCSRSAIARETHAAIGRKQEAACAGSYDSLEATCVYSLSDGSAEQECFRYLLGPGLARYHAIIGEILNATVANAVQIYPSEFPINNRVSELPGAQVIATQTVLAQSASSQLADRLDHFDGDTSSAQWGVDYVKDIMFDRDLTMVPRVPIQRSPLKGKMAGTVADNLAMYTTAYGLCDIAVRLQGIPDELSRTPTLRHRRQPGWIGKNTCIQGLRDITAVLQTFLRKGEALDLSVEVAPPCVSEDPCYTLANYAVSAGAAKKAMNILRNISLAGFCISAMKKLVILSDYPCLPSEGNPSSIARLASVVKSTLLRGTLDDCLMFPPDLEEGHLEVPEDVTRLAPAGVKIADPHIREPQGLGDEHQTHETSTSTCRMCLASGPLPTIDLVKQAVCQEELLINHRRFGTEKPAQLRSMEDEVWRELFQLSDNVKTPSQVFMSCRERADTWLKGCAQDPATSTFFAREGVHVSDATRFWIHDQDPPHQPLAIPSPPLNISSHAPAIPTQTPDVLLLTAAAPTPPPNPSFANAFHHHLNAWIVLPRHLLLPAVVRKRLPPHLNTWIVLPRHLLPPTRRSQTPSTPTQRPDTPSQTPATSSKPPDGSLQTPPSTKADNSKEKSAAIDKSAQEPPAPRPPTKPRKQKGKWSTKAGLSGTSKGATIQISGDEGSSSGGKESNVIPLVEYKGILAISPHDLAELNDDIAHKIEMDEGTHLSVHSEAPANIGYTHTGLEHVHQPLIHNPADYEAWEEVFSAARASQNGSARPFFLDRPDDSIIYRCTEAEYGALTDSTVQGILRRQNIVITGCSDRKVEFNLTGLETLGDLDEPIDIQDQSIELDDKDPDFQRRVCQGTLRLLYDASVAPPDFDKSLNAIAFLCLRQASGRQRMRLMSGLSIAQSWNSRAYGSSPPMQCYLALPQQVVLTIGGTLTAEVRPQWSEGSFAPMVDTSWSTEEVDVRKLNYDDWHIEIVVLNAGDRLLMRPTTPHCVFTTENAICHGGHFLAASTLQRTVAGSIHTFFRGGVITNTDHPSFQGRMNTIACFFYKAIVLGDTHDLDKGHVPDFTTASGLTDLIVFACGIELQNAICPLSYKPTDDDHSVAMLKKCGVSPDDALQKYDFSQSTHEMRVQNVQSRGRVIALLEFIFARVDVIDKGDGSHLNPCPTPLVLFWPEFPQVTVSPAHNAVDGDSGKYHGLYIDPSTDIPEESDLASKGLRAGDTMYFSCYAYITAPSSTRVTPRRTRSPSLAEDARKRPRHK
ncbi:hypothetical protein BKA70DRAFT_1237562 [Coprinopsis sp. MPI-PUGE-AT-0042]|nr:hypothetical protein BKA70DRAFT_1237562 [Coprinopsis sp. MPI-PUGE-AT-0042]